MRRLARSNHRSQARSGARPSPQLVQLNELSGSAEQSPQSSCCFLLLLLSAAVCCCCCLLLLLLLSAAVCCCLLLRLSAAAAVCCYVRIPAAALILLFLWRRCCGVAVMASLFFSVPCLLAEPLPLPRVHGRWRHPSLRGLLPVATSIHWHWLSRLYCGRCQSALARNTWPLAITRVCMSPLSPLSHLLFRNQVLSRQSWAVRVSVSHTHHISLPIDSGRALMLRSTDPG